jgi:hypothetical protein
MVPCPYSSLEVRALNPWPGGPDTRVVEIIGVTRFKLALLKLLFRPTGCPNALSRDMSRKAARSTFSDTKYGFESDFDCVAVARSAVV